MHLVSNGGEEAGFRVVSGQSPPPPSLVSGRRPQSVVRFRLYEHSIARNTGAETVLTQQSTILKYILLVISLLPSVASNKMSRATIAFSTDPELSICGLARS